MKILYTKSEFKNSRSKDKLLLECYNCEKSFHKIKKDILLTLKKHKSKNNYNYENSCKYCSKTCLNKHHSKINSKIVNCKNCKIEFKKVNAEIKKFPNHFCSQSCAATYNNTHKKYGIRRSKLEKHIEEQLPKIYPTLEIHYNRKDTINSELDIYIPSLKLAFELNGIFHYEPIYGQNKLSKTIKNDQSKSKACHDHKIDLCIIDVSHLKYFKPSNAQPYLDIIANIIKERL